MKTFCFGCKKVRQPDGSWKEEEEFDMKLDSSTMCPDCLKKERARMMEIMQKNKKEKSHATV